jgi:predicted dehydrogenase
MSGQTAATPRIALVGCGAIAETFHLQALLRHPDVASAVTFVDRDAARAKRLADKAGSTRVATDLGAVMGEIDGAIVATPHRLHQPLSLQLARAGKHVLCEKPVAETAAEVEALVEAADRAGVTVAVNNGRRLFPTFREVKTLVESGALGTVREMELVLGEKFDWPAASGDYFGVRAHGHGVLADTGAHVVDLLVWWMGATPRLVTYEDDAWGGTEAVAKLEAEHGACRGTVHLSWLSKLPNTFAVRGDLGSVEGTMYDWKELTRTDASGRSRKVRLGAPAKDLNELGYGMIDRLIETIRTGAAPLVSARDVAPSIALIAECYASRRTIAEPWHDVYAEVADVAR